MNDGKFLAKIGPENPIKNSIETKCFEYIFLNWIIRSVADTETSVDWSLFLKMSTKSLIFFLSAEVLKT